MRRAVTVGVIATVMLAGTSPAAGTWSDSATVTGKSVTAGMLEAPVLGCEPSGLGSKVSWTPSTVPTALTYTAQLLSPSSPLSITSSSVTVRPARVDGHGAGDCQPARHVVDGVQRPGPPLPPDPGGPDRLLHLNSPRGAQPRSTGPTSQPWGAIGCSIASVPPSTNRHAPTMLVAPSESRKQTGAATSSGRPVRPIAVG